jgi:hypothetical protein
MFVAVIALFLGTIVPTASLETRFHSREEAAQHFHELGLHAAQGGDLSSALGLLRAAVKAKPNDSILQNDLGVTEANLGLLEKAQQRFLRAIDLDFNNRDALKNLKSLNIEIKKMSKSSKKVSLPSSGSGDNFRKRQHEILPVDELSEIPEIKSHSDESPVLLKPFVIRKSLQKLGWFQSSEILKYLSEAFGEESVDYYPQNMHTSQPEKVYFLPLSRAIEQIIDVPDQVFMQVDASLSGSYAQWNMKSSSWMSVLHFLNLSEAMRWPFHSSSVKRQSGSEPQGSSSVFETVCPFERGMTDYNSFFKKSHWIMLLLGEKDSGMHNHKDDLRTASFQAQILGRKWWNLCPPEKISSYNGSRSHDNSSGLSYMYKSAAIDTFSDRINYKKYPLFVNATCFQVVLQPGDIIYYPSDYWHQTRNLDTPSLALSRNVVSRESAGPVAARLQTECASVPAICGQRINLKVGKSESPDLDENVDTQVCIETEHESAKAYDWASPTYGFSILECHEILQLLDTWPNEFGFNI